ncbi:hypothetical protein Tco_1276337 [Tanacetum coccineum]
MLFTETFELSVHPGHVHPDVSHVNDELSERSLRTLALLDLVERNPHSSVITSETVPDMKWSFFNGLHNVSSPLSFPRQYKTYTLLPRFQKYLFFNIVARIRTGTLDAPCILDNLINMI